MSIATVDTNFDLAQVNQQLDPSDPMRTIEWAAERFGDGLIMSSSFGADSAVLLHMATRIVPSIKVVFVDTGFLFPDTHEFMETLRQRLGLNVWSFRTRKDPITYLHEAGEENPQFRQDVPACCAANKNEPFERAMRELEPAAWLRGVRKHQNDHRNRTEVVEFAQRYNCYAVSPLLGWTGQQIQLYHRQHNLPRHPLFAKGYLSIGCNPLSCTRPASEDGDERSGRWSDSEKSECGINLINSLDSAQL